jgi:aspartate carbamoyltransferase regulatory subunit
MQLKERLSVEELVLVSQSCRNKKCEKHKHLIFAAMIKKGEVIKLTCPFCERKYEVSGGN